MSTIKVQNIYETTNFFTDYFLSRTGVKNKKKIPCGLYMAENKYFCKQNKTYKR